MTYVKPSLDTNGIIVRLVVRLQTGGKLLEVGGEVSLKVVKPNLVVEARVKVVAARRGGQAEVGTVIVRRVAVDRPVGCRQIFNLERDREVGAGGSGKVGYEPVGRFRLRLFAARRGRNHDKLFSFVFYFPSSLDEVVGRLVGERDAERRVGRARDLLDVRRLVERDGSVGIVEVEILKQLLHVWVCRCQSVPLGSSGQIGSVLTVRALEQLMPVDGGEITEIVVSRNVVGEVSTDEPGLGQGDDRSQDGERREEQHRVTRSNADVARGKG